MLHNPLDVARFDPNVMSRAQARQTLALAADAKIIGLIAQITPWKGQDAAIRAVGLLRDRHPDARLLLVGETKFVDKATRFDNRSYEGWLRKLVRALDLEGHVEFWGEREDITTVMRALDVLVAPSWEEPFGRSIIEAMALETAVIATNVGGPSEYIEHGVDGLTLPPRDVGRWAVALDRLLSDVPLREDMARRGSQKATDLFDRRDYVSGVLEVYDEVALGPAWPRLGHRDIDGRRDLDEPLVPRMPGGDA